MRPRRRAATVHIDDKIAAQLATRGWTEQQINDVVDAPAIGTSTDYTGSNQEPAKAYGSRTGGCVVVNDRTGRMIQISDKNDPGWIADGRIEWT